MSGPEDRPSLGETRTTPFLVETALVPRIEVVVERQAGEADGRSLVVEGGRCRIGSHPSNDVVLKDKLVSRFHCELVESKGRWRLVDGGSLNGTRIAGVVARDADLPMPECRVSLGETSLLVRAKRARTEEELPVWPNFGALYGGSVAMRRLFAQLDKVARSEASVLVEGESGTGKELVASELVQRGPRAQGPFLIVDCGAISPSLIESELFGHVRGSFTGAHRDRIGAFEAASGGTLFLDEIGELPLDMQPKLLRALEAHEVRRIGENRARKVDVRVVAATNRRLEREVNHGRFREDLYFRLSVVNLRLPPLRERLEDLGMLVDVFLADFGAQDKAHLFTPEVLADMARYDWPGNVRELRNHVERIVVFDKVPPAGRASFESPDSRPEPRSEPRPDSRRDAPSRPSGTRPPESRQPEVDLDLPFTEGKERLVADYERRYLQALLRWAGGNVTRASRKAGMDRMYLHRLLQKHGMHAAAFKLPGGEGEG